MGGGGGFRAGFLVPTVFVQNKYTDQEMLRRGYDYLRIIFLEKEYWVSKKK